MRFLTSLIPVALATFIASLALPAYLNAQVTNSTPATAAVEIPDSPQPAAEYSSSNEQTGSDSAQAGFVQAPSSALPGNSSSQAAAQQPEQGKDKALTAEEQLKQQEHQRVLGVMATFNTTTDRNALPLSPKQKFQLFFKSATDPWPFLLAGVVAGIGQLENSNPEWGQGMQGYGKRIGAGYSDYFIGNFFGNAVLPSLMHEDPRYFQKGTGTGGSRFLWAAGSTVWCKRDKGGFGPNYANVVGNFIGVAIARAYYPPSDRTVIGTIQDGLTVNAEGIVGAEVIEFWPDIARHYKRKHAEKLARQEAVRLAKSTALRESQSAPVAQPRNP